MRQMRLLANQVAQQLFLPAGRAVLFLFVVMPLFLLAGCDGETEVLPLPAHPAAAIPAFEKVWPPPAWRALAIAPDGAGLVAIGEDGEVATSTNDGLHWRVVGNVGAAAEFSSISAKPKGPLVAVGSGGAVVRSVDGGAHWSEDRRVTKNALRSVTATSRGALVAVGDQGIIIRYDDVGAIWSVVGVTGNSLARVIATPDGPLIAVGSNGAILRSDDDGITWNEAHNRGPKLDLQSVIAVPGRAGTLVAVGSGGTVVCSVDSGQSWFPVRSGPDKILWSVAAAPTGELFIFGEENIVLRSEDGGKEWMPGNNATLGRMISNLITTPGGAFLGISELSEIMRLNDRAATWSVVASGYTNVGFMSATVRSGPGGAFIAVGSAGTVLRSVDDGKSWVSVPPVDKEELLRCVIAVPAFGGFVAVGERGSIIRLKDDGTQWSAISSPTTAPLLQVIAVPSGKTLVAIGMEGAVVRSVDGGFSWSTARKRATKLTLNRVVADPALAGTMVAVGEAGTIVRSDDSGDTWLQVSSTTESGLNGIIATYKPAGALVAVGTEGVIVRSTDRGLSWSHVASSGTWPTLTSITADPEGHLLAQGEDGSVIRSADSGVNWSLASKDSNRLTLNSVAVEPGGALVAAGLGGTIQRSNDGGASWSAPIKSGTLKMLNTIVERDGTLIAAGAAIVRGTRSSALEPVIQRITQAYAGMPANPVLRIVLDDPANLCPNGTCLSVEANSSGPNRLGFVPNTQISVKAGNAKGHYLLSINPNDFGVQRPHPIFVRIRAAGPGFSRIYPTGDTYFTIANNPDPWYQRHWAIGIGASLLLAASFYLMLISKPLLLLGLVTQPAILDSAGGVGGPVGKTLIGLLRTLLLPLLAHHPRVLNAWIEKNAHAVRGDFELSTQAAADRDVPYMALPVDGPDNDVFAPGPQSVKRYFQAPRSFIQIIGPGGAGKTRLAIEIGRWLFDGLVVEHPVAVLFIDEEFTDLLTVVQAKLRVSLEAPLPPPNFIGALLSKGRLCVIVDRVSERQLSTREAVAKVYRVVALKVMICTARYPIDTEGARPIRLRPRPLDETTLLAFLGEQLKASNAGNLFARLADQARLVEGLAKQITVANDELPITPLLVRVFVAQAIELARTRGVIALRDLPDSIPEAYFAYVEQLDAAKHTVQLESSNARELIRRAAVVIAFVELGDDFRPKPVPVADVEQALRSDPRLANSNIDYLRRVEDNGLLVRRISGAEATVEYILDPLAECMAAFEHARRAGPDPQRWHLLIEKISERGENAKGFMLALQMNHAAYGAALGFPAVVFPRALAGPTPIR